MYFPERADQPPFDVVLFEAQATARAAELVDQVARLAVHKCETLSERIAGTGAQYDLPDSSRLAVQREVWDQDLRQVVARVRLTHPPAEVLGSDGQERRITLTRYIMYQSFYDKLDDFNELDMPPEMREDFEEAQHSWQPGLGRIIAQAGQERLEGQLDPDYHPPELIVGRTSTLVECKLPNSPNYRTECNHDSLPPEMRGLYIPAHHRAGGDGGNSEGVYDVPEHKALIARLNTVNPAIQEPQLLDPDFGPTWLEPTPSAHIWLPHS